jgi:uncharacterized protein (DUF58 family)
MRHAIIKRFANHPFRWHEICRGILAGLTLLLALGASLASSVTARSGNLSLTLALTLVSLLLAGIIAYAVIPGLMRRARLEWRAFSFHITREGWYFLLAMLIVGLAALNTNNNLLFIVFSATLSLFVVSGMLSWANLKGVGLELDLPETIEAKQRFRAPCQLENRKEFAPAFSVSVIESAVQPEEGREEPPSIFTARCLSYFPFLPCQTRAQNWVSLEFPRRGRYSARSLEIASGFPFGFVRRTRSVESGREVIALPELEPPNEFFETLPLLKGTFESNLRGDGADLYSIRDYGSQENARFIDWKSTAKTSQLKIREFTREDERKCCFVFDNGFHDFGERQHRILFEKAVRLSANAARHFHEMGCEIRLITPQASTGFDAQPSGLLDILKILAVIEPDPQGGLSMAELAAEPVFKVLFTAQSRGAIPTPVWNSAHVVFIRELK